MLSHLRRAHHQEFERYYYVFDGQHLSQLVVTFRNSMPARSIVTQFEQWKTSGKYRMRSLVICVTYHRTIGSVDFVSFSFWLYDL